MGKITMLVGSLWIGGIVILLLIALSCALFNNPTEGVSRFGLFWGRVGVAFLWPLMLLSSGGRSKILTIWKDEHFYE